MTKTKTTNPTLEQQNLYLKTLCRVYEKMIYRLYKGIELSTGEFYNLINVIERFEKDEQ